MGTGLRPNRMPKEWERRPLQMTGKEADGPQGPSELRSINSPQGEFPAEVINTMEQAPGDFITQIIAGRPGLEKSRARPGDDSNQSGPIGGFPGPKEATGKIGKKLTGTPVMGQTLKKGTI